MGAYLSRRNVLRAGIGVAAAASLAACGDGGPTVPLRDNATVRLPDYIPFQGVKPDYPGTASGVLNGFLHYPEKPVAAFPDGPPAKGPSINVMTLTFNPVPPPASRNQLWRELNRSLGTELKYEIVPVSEYPTKFSLTIAGGDLPDAMLVLPTAPQQPPMLNAMFEDLSEHLSGDAVRDYPYLANIPSQSWKSMVFNGGIYGLPMPRLNSGSATFYRTDLFKAKGVDPEIGSFKEFLAAAKAMSEPRKNKYMMGDPLTSFYFVMEMLHSPLEWHQEDGKFRWWLEDIDRVKQGLDAMRQLVKAHVIHPDGFTVLGKFKDWFGNGQIAMNYDGQTAWNDYLRVYGATNKGFDIDGVLAPDFDGDGVGVHWAGASNYAMLALKKAPKQRVKQVLRAMNALASPFGTDGYLTRKYGIAGHDYKAQGADPILSPTGTIENTVPTTMTTDAPQSLYFPENPKVVPRQHAYQTKAVAVLVNNAAEGLYSETNSTIGGTIKENINNDLKGIMQGRLPVSALDGIMRQWRIDMGDKTRGELEKYYAGLHR